MMLSPLSWIGFVPICLLMQGTFTSADSPLSSVCENITASVTNCTNDRFATNMHSPCNPSAPYEGDSVTMWQLFSITLLECDMKVSTCGLVVNYEWSRNHALELSNHTTSITDDVVMDDNKYKVKYNVSLTLHNIAIQPDLDPDYKVVLSVSNCNGLSLEGSFGLTIEPRCKLDFPAPLQNHLTVTGTAGAAQCPRMEATFIGGSQSGQYYFEWVAKTNNKTLCFSYRSNEVGRYVCGWEVTNEITCNHTAWLVIRNCSSSDAGNYTVRARGDSTSGDPANVLLSFQQSDDEDTRRLNIVNTVSIVIGVLVFLTVAIVVVIVIVVAIRRHSSPPAIHTDATTHMNPPPSSISATTTTFAQVHTNQDGVNTMVGSTIQSTMVSCTYSTTSGQGIWKSTNTSKQLKQSDLLPISKVITHWKELARHLGLTKANIVTIEHDHQYDYEEQKYQMLRKWFDQQQTPPSRQNLIKIIAEKMKDPELAGEVVSVLYGLDMEEGEKLRSRSCHT